MNPIEKTRGPCIILAGAGTGKTYTIVEKIKYILKNKVYNPEKIVCLTFSNEAANSLRERVIPHINEGKEPIIKTFHSFCTEIIKNHGERIGIKKNFHILLPDDAKIMLYKNLKIKTNLCHKYINSIGTAKDLGISHNKLKLFLDKKIPEEKEKIFEKELEKLRFQLQTLHIKKELINNHEKLNEEKQIFQEKIKSLEYLINLKKFYNTWGAYERLKAKKNLWDYSDLNKNALELLKKYPEISKEYDYIIVEIGRAHV